MLVLAWRIWQKKVRTLGFDFWPPNFWRAESSVEMAAKWGYSCTVGDETSKLVEKVLLNPPNKSVWCFCKGIWHTLSANGWFFNCPARLPQQISLWIPQVSSIHSNCSYLDASNSKHQPVLAGSFGDQKCDHQRYWYYGCRMGAEWSSVQMVADGWRLGSLDSLPALSGPFRSELLSPKVTSQTRVAVNEGFLTRKDKRLCVNLRILKTYGFFFHFSC